MVFSIECQLHVIRAYTLVYYLSGLLIDTLGYCLNKCADIEWKKLIEASKTRQRCINGCMSQDACSSDIYEWMTILTNDSLVSCTQMVECALSTQPRLRSIAVSWCAWCFYEIVKFLLSAQTGWKLTLSIPFSLSDAKRQFWTIGHNDCVQYLFNTLRDSCHSYFESLMWILH